MSCKTFWPIFAVIVTTAFVFGGGAPFAAHAKTPVETCTRLLARSSDYRGLHLDMGEGPESLDANNGNLSCIARIPIKLQRKVLKECHLGNLCTITGTIDLEGQAKTVNDSVWVTIIIAKIALVPAPRYVHSDVTGQGWVRTVELSCGNHHEEEAVKFGAHCVIYTENLVRVLDKPNGELQYSLASGYKIVVLQKKGEWTQIGIEN
jgi:hypothetical protein